MCVIKRVKFRARQHKLKDRKKVSLLTEIEQLPYLIFKHFTDLYKDNKVEGKIWKCEVYLFATLQ